MAKVNTGKNSVNMNITLPKNVYEKLCQYSESVSLSKSVAISQLLQQGLEATMAMNTLDKLLEMVQQEAINSAKLKTIDG